MADTQESTTLFTSKSSGYITGKDLSHRKGWSSYTIFSFLGEADKYEVRHLPHATFTISLFSVARIEAVEATAEWQSISDGQYFSIRKRERTANRDNAMDRVRTFDIKVRNFGLPREFIIDAAMANYNEHKTYAHNRAGLTPHDPIDAHSAPEQLVLRLTLNYLRHNLTNYDYAVKRLALIDGRKEEYLALRARYYKTMRHHFSEFAEELTAEEKQKATKDYESYEKKITRA